MNRTAKKRNATKRQLIIQGVEKVEEKKRSEQH